MASLSNQYILLLPSVEWIRISKYFILQKQYLFFFQMIVVLQIWNVFMLWLEQRWAQLWWIYIEFMQYNVNNCIIHIMKHIKHLNEILTGKEHFCNSINALQKHLECSRFHFSPDIYSSCYPAQEIMPWYDLFNSTFPDFRDIPKAIDFIGKKAAPWIFLLQITVPSNTILSFPSSPFTRCPGT